MNNGASFPVIEDEENVLLADGEVYPLPNDKLIVIHEGFGDLFLQHSSSEVSLPKFSRIGSVKEGAPIFSTASDLPSTSLLFTCAKTTLLRIIPIEKVKVRLRNTPTVIYYLTDAIDAWLRTLNAAMPLRSNLEAEALHKNDTLEFNSYERRVVHAALEGPCLWIKGEIQTVYISGCITNIAPKNIPAALPLLQSQNYIIENALGTVECRSTEELLRTPELNWFSGLQSCLLAILERGFLIKGMRYRSMDLVIGSLLSKDISSLEPFQEAMLVINQIMGRELVRSSELSYIPSGSLENRIRMLSQAAHVRCRLIDFAKGWKNLPPYIIGFWGPHSIPVALFYRGKKDLQPSLPKSFINLSSSKNIASKSFLQLYGYELYPLLYEKINHIFSLLKATVMPMKKDLLVLLFSVIGIGILGLYTPILTKYIYDLIIPGGDYELLYQMTIGMVIILLISSLYSFSSSIIINRILTLFKRNTTGALWDKILQRKTSHIDKTNSGEIFWRLRVIEEMPHSISEQIILLALAAPVSLIYLLFMFYLSWPLALIVIGITVICCVIAMITTIKEKNIKRELWPLEEKVEAFLLSTIKGVNQIRVAMVEEPMLEQWEDMLITTQRYHLQATRWRNFSMIVLESAPLVSILLIFTIVWYQALSGAASEAFTIGSFLAFLSIEALFSKNIFTFLKMALPWVDLYTMWERSKTLLDEKYLEPTRLGGYYGHYSGRITVKGLVFSYSKDAKDVFEDVSFTIKENTFNVITGPSGCGKTTLLRLLTSLEKPQGGTILYDGKPFTEWNEESLRTQIGVIISSTQTFQGTLRDNVLCGRRVSKKVFDQALAMSGLNEVLEKLPMGLETLLTGSENTLSGGECQRVVLARAMLNNPSLLILDEATSALDNNTQQKILENIKAAGTTVLMVTHRLEIKAFADHLFRMEKGLFIQES